MVMIMPGTQRMRIWLRASLLATTLATGALAQPASVPQGSTSPPAVVAPPVAAPPSVAPATSTAPVTTPLVVAPPPPAPAETAKPAEVPKPAAEAGAGDIREIAARPVLRLKGQSTWDEGFAALKKAFGALQAEAGRLNLPREGNPMAYFIESDDLGFTYEAMLPLAAAVPAGTALGAGFDAALSPGGRAVVFPHEGAYDEIDTAYEALTAWLDDKNLVSTGKFLEEYEFMPEKSDETTMKLKIMVFLK
jgi:effector-binding domain-containing protein